MSTLTVYPDAGDPGTTSCDGWIRRANNAAWATARDTASGETKGTTAAVTYITRTFQDADGLNFDVGRSLFLFDTSALTAAASISAGVVSFAGTGNGTENQSTTALHVVASTPASNTTLALADFSQIGSTSFGSIDFASYVITDGTYNNITLNASGLAAISKTSISKFAVRDGLDLSNTSPAINKLNIVYAYLADQAGTTTDPKLVVTYTISAIKTFNGIAIGSVKTVNGIAMASIKTINGVT